MKDEIIFILIVNILFLEGDLPHAMSYGIYIFF